MFSIPLPPLLVLFHETNYKLVVFKTLWLEQVFSHSVQFIHLFIHRDVWKTASDLCSGCWVRAINTTHRFLLFRPCWN